MPGDVTLDELVQPVAQVRAGVPPTRSALVALSGIDASGKGFVARRLAAELEAHRLNVAAISVDPWLNLPRRRFGSGDPGPHFYAHALRLDEMFEQLVLPSATPGRWRSRPISPRRRRASSSEGATASATSM